MLRRPSTLLLAIALSIPAVAAGPIARPAAATEVYGDDQGDRYVGTGGLILPGGVDPGTRTTVSTCLDCEWRLSTPCQLTSAGHPFDGQSPCMSVVRGCPAMQQLLRGWFRRGSGAWHEIGLVCIGADGPTTVVRVGRQTRERFVAGLPLLRARRQPAAGAVTQIPVVFGSSQSDGLVRTSYALAGQAVQLEARPLWEWDYGDGAGLVTGDPGGRYPHEGVSHAYRQSGTYVARVTTRWTARFWVAGLGPFDVAPTVTQSDEVTVSVGEGRAVLAVR